MSIRERLSGNEATAFAMKQINPDVVAAFPITPSTEIPQGFLAEQSNSDLNEKWVIGLAWSHAVFIELLVFLMNGNKEY